MKVAENMMRFQSLGRNELIWMSVKPAGSTQNHAAIFYLSGIVGELSERLLFSAGDLQREIYAE